MPPPTDPNLDIAALLLDLSEVYRPAPKFWGYKNASRSIRRHPDFLSDLSDTEILKIAGVGPASLRVVREYLDTGESPTVSRIVGESGKAKEIEARRGDARSVSGRFSDALARQRRHRHGRDAREGMHEARLSMHVRDRSFLRPADRRRHDDG